MLQRKPHLDLDQGKLVVAMPPREECYVSSPNTCVTLSGFKPTGRFTF